MGMHGIARAGLKLPNVLLLLRNTSTGATNSGTATRPRLRLLWTANVGRLSLSTGEGFFNLEKRPAK